MSQHSEAEMYQKHLEMEKLLDVYLNHFPKFEKYGICTRIRNHAGDMFDAMIASWKLFHKKTSLTNLDLHHEQLRMNVMKAYDRGLFKFNDGKISDKSPDELAKHRYLTLSMKIDELGRMIGGWQRDEREKEKLREQAKKEQQREVS